MDALQFDPSDRFALQLQRKLIKSVKEDFYA